MHVATGGKEAGKAPVFAFNVVNQLSGVDKASWDYVSQYASEAEVFAYLEQNNIQRTDLGRIAWRCRQSPDFYRQIIKLLAERHVWDDTLTSYAVYHNDKVTLGEWLKHQYSEEFGPVLDSPLVKFEPLEFDLYEHLEYSPLINQRAHRLGREWRIANQEVLAQYQRLLATLSFKPALGSTDNLAVAYYLFLQDRVEEALGSSRPSPPRTWIREFNTTTCAAKPPSMKAIRRPHAPWPPPTGTTQSPGGSNSLEKCFPKWMKSTANPQRPLRMAPRLNRIVNASRAHFPPPSRPSSSRWKTLPSRSPGEI